MAVIEFGVTQTDVAALYFPQWRGGFSSSSAPTAATVATCITESAALVNARLYAETITASAISSGSVAYVMCASQVKRLTALRILRELTQQNPDLAKSLEEEIDAWFTRLAADGGTFLGDETLQTGASDPDGPTSHISEYSLTVDSAINMSTTVPRLRRDDQL